MRSVVMVTLLTLLTSCVGFQGNLVVNEQFVVKEKKKSVVVPEGVYSARLKMQSKRKLKLEIEGNSVKKKAKIKVAKGFKLPTHDGDFEIPASALNQSFKIQGHKQTTVSRTQPVTESQYCTVRRVRTVCGKECSTRVITLPDGTKRKKRTCKRVCRDVVRHIAGSKLVTYHYKTVKQKLDLSLVDASSLAPVADYTGGNSATSTVHDHIGLCRINRLR